MITFCSFFLNIEKEVRNEKKPKNSSKFIFFYKKKRIFLTIQRILKIQTGFEEEIVMLWNHISYFCVIKKKKFFEHMK